MGRIDLLAVFVIAIAFIGGCSARNNCSNPTRIETADINSAVYSITADDLRVRIGFIASDAMKGRATPSPELEKTAYHIAREFSSFGLRPGVGKFGIQTFRRSLLSIRQHSKGFNVIWWLEGSDSILRNEFIIFSAHMDHVGVRNPVDGDSIYNGADDNASGVGAMLELAQAFSRLRPRPRRTIVFIAFGGEELGLIGSMLYVGDWEGGVRPVFPLEDTVAVINMDMIGRNEGDRIAMVTSSTALRAITRQIATEHPELGLIIMSNPWPSEHLLRRGDHFSFLRHGVPAVLFTSGPHADYHQPSDEADRLDYDKIERVTRLIFHLGLELANQEQSLL